MNHVNAFERLVADVADELMGPSRPFDARAIVQSAKTPARRHRWIDVVQGTVRRQAAPMEGGFDLFSALKFVVASVIVALFGGFLLAGVLTTQQGDEMAPAAVTESPSPRTTDELLSGMETEELEPGVLHILNDGVRALAHLDTTDCGDAVLVDGAGAVWRFVDGERYFRLGAEEEWPQETCLGIGDDYPAVVDGRFVTRFDEVTDLLGPQPATIEELGLDSGLDAMEAQADGTLWLLGQDRSLVRAPLGGVAEVIDWEDVYDGLLDGFRVTSDGDAWLRIRSVGSRTPSDEFPAVVLLHFDGQDWETVQVPDDMAAAVGGTFDVGPDGTLWAMEGYNAPHRSLVRYDGLDWTIFGEADGVRPWGERATWGWTAPKDEVVAPDGSVWVIATGPGEMRCGGLGRFDGESWASYLADMCIGYYDIAPDGAVWVVAADPDPVGGGVLSSETYVITPEAIAAKGSELSERPLGEEAKGAEEASSTTADLLSGMVTEEAEPGVVRVVNDGYRDVPYREDFCYPWDCGVVIVGDNGHVWRTTGQWLYRLGQDGEWDEDEWGDGSELAGLSLELRYSVMADHDGRLWAMSDSGPQVFDDGAWVPGVPGVDTNLDPFRVQADGTIWLFGQDLCWRGESATGCTSWPDVYDGGEYETGEAVVTDDGEVWLLARPEADGGISVLRFDGTEWQVIPAPEGVSGDNVVGGSMAPVSDVAPAGTLWTVGDSLPQHRSLARLDETGWTIFDDADGVRTWGGQEAWWGSKMDMLRVTSDGSAWVNATVPGTRACDGLARFDGDSWRSFLSGYCISDYDLAPDGTVWVVAQDPERREVDTFAITSEAVSSIE